MPQNSIPSSFQYVDIDISFTPNPVTGDVSVKQGDAAVIQSVKNLVFTAFYERPFQPSKGSSVEQHLFKPGTPLTAQHLKDGIEDVINNYEPRVKLVNVSVTADSYYKAFKVVISFYITNGTNLITISLQLMNRVR